MAVDDKRIMYKEIALNGRLRTNPDSSQIGHNDFSDLTNLRPGEISPVGISGQTKINTTALSQTAITNAIHFAKGDIQESHVLAQAGGYVFENPTAIPNAGDFTATAIFTESSGYGTGRFSKAPLGMVAYANGVDTCLYPGNEMQCAGVLDWDAVGNTYKYDWTEQLSNTKSDSTNIATLHRYTNTIDANTMLLLSLDNNVTDTSPATPHTVTNTNVTFTTSSKFGTHAGVWNGTNAVLTVPDNADFDFSGGTFTYDAWIYWTGSGQDSLYMQGTATDYFEISINSNCILVEVVAASSATVSLSTPAGSITTNTWYHVAVIESGDSWGIFINGALAAYLSDTDRCANYSSVVYLGARINTLYFSGRMDEVRVSDSVRWATNFSPSTVAYAATNYTDIYVASTLPLSGVKFYVGTANTGTGSASVYYWNGANWTTIGAVTDGTASGGVSLAQTGTMTFASTVSVAKLRAFDDLILYWYKVQISEVDTTTTLTRVTVVAPMQQIKDIWDAQARVCASCQVFKSNQYNDYTGAVFEDAWESSNTASYANIGSLPALTGDIYFGFTERMQGIKIGLAGGFTNATACSLKVSYYNGGDPTAAGGWTALSVNDQTSYNNASFGQSGFVTWTPPAKNLEFKRYLAGNAGQTNILEEDQRNSGKPKQQPIYFFGEMPVFGEEEDKPIESPKGIPTSKTALYYYRFSFSATLSSTVYLFFAGGIPAQVDIRGYKFPVQHGDALMLVNNMDMEPNAVLISEPGTSQVFNGALSFKDYIGGDTEVVAGGPIYFRTTDSIVTTSVLCKVDETWIYTGSSPDTYKSYRISEGIGCVAPLSFAVTPAGVQINQIVRKTVAIWLSQVGVVLFDGTDIRTISDDIKDLFNPQRSTYLGASVIPNCVGWIDPLYNEYHLVVQNDVEWVFQVDTAKWFKISRGAGAKLYGGFPAFATTGIPHSYGWDQSGFIFRLENGTGFNGNAIAHSFSTGDIAPHGNDPNSGGGSIAWRTELRSARLTGKAKETTTNTIAVSHYGDTATAASTPTITAMSMSNSGKRLFKVIRSFGMNSKRHVYHKLSFSVSTDDETIGFEPLYLTLGYIPIELDTR